MSDSPKKLRALDVARKLSISLTYVYQLLWSGRLPASKRGKEWEIEPAAVEAYSLKVSGAE